MREKINGALERVSEILYGLGQDKLLHFTCGMIIAAFVALVLGGADSAPLMAAVVIGFLKELADQWLKDCEPDGWDFLATAAGGLLINVFVWL